MPLASYADCFTLRFVFNVNIKNINVQARVVHNYPSSRHDNEQFLVYIKHAHLKLKLFSCRTNHLLLSGPLSLFTKCGLDFKVLQFATYMS